MNNRPTTPQGYASPPFPPPPHAGYGPPPRKSNTTWIIIIVLLVLGLPVILVVFGAVAFFMVGRSSATAPNSPPKQVEQTKTEEPILANTVLQTEQWTCIRVIDGNTIEVQHPSDSNWVERVRLLCIDTPERGQPGYDEATRALEKLVLDEQIITELDPKHDKRDRYGRILAYVILAKPAEEGVPDSGGYTNVNVEMVKLGHSKYFTESGPSSMYAAEFEAAARKAD